ncbi:MULTISPECIES: hypothetical protein [unclassified Streptomyces]|uniref:hypothetical protein n=1 Tax=unclassified Streptomyces TaxID=2593676 RepID=UPI0022564B7E|nr:MULTISPECIES: hypothetical protein [unclassified Streptomyces]MCX4993323.1 hypothetical protein [Streptomyces sp. NBC_00568]MCX5009246.1 hypothetical protein [Streptomyces sp. NBC_00638]
MAELVRQQHLDADVGYHGFGFQESDDGDILVPFPDDFADEVFLNAFPGRLDIYSAGHTHTASVTVEVWDGPPASHDRVQWDEQAEADYESTSGEVAVWSMSLGRADDVITLADSGGLWRVRVSCTGRAAAARLSEEEGTGHGVEKYLVQFWPRTA